MLSIWINSLAAVAIVSLISLVGVFALSINQSRLKRILVYLVSFSVGALLGDVFLHILPELGEEGFHLAHGVYMLLGIIVFFVLERMILWHHSHLEHTEDVHATAYLILLGDALHNFIDGMIIAASFLVSPSLGITATLVVVFHEIPQEIGDFAILIHGGWKANKALFYNFLSACTSVFGALAVLIFAKFLEPASGVLLALAGASFLYVAMTDLIPELHKERSPGKSLLQLLSLLIGVMVMAGLLFLE